MNKPQNLLIQEAYREFTPSVNVKKTVQILLEYVPPEDLAHLQSIILTNTAALSRGRKRQRSSSGASIPLVGGLYTQTWQGQPAYIEIFADNILNSGSWYDLRIPILRYLMFAKILYHEIGHHVQYISKSKLTDKEGFANRQAAQLSRKFFRQHYWYLLPFKVPIKVLNWLMKKLRVAEWVEKHGRVENR